MPKADRRSRCPECGHRWPDGTFGTLMCPDCRTEVKLRAYADPEVRPKPERLMAEGARKARSMLSPSAGWSIAWSGGMITVCGACYGIAADYNDASRSKERIVKLVAYVRTNVCKHCGGPYDARHVCPTRVLRGDADIMHQRRYFVRSLKVPACQDCAGQAEIEVDPDLLVKDETGWWIVQVEALAEWERALEDQGCL